jgi:hypothetical protein
MFWLRCSKTVSWNLSKLHNSWMPGVIYLSACQVVLWVLDLKRNWSIWQISCKIYESVRVQIHFLLIIEHGNSWTHRVCLNRFRNPIGRTRPDSGLSCQRKKKKQLNSEVCCISNTNYVSINNKWYSPVSALCYKPKRRGIESRWCQFFQLT